MEIKSLDQFGPTVEERGYNRSEMWLAEAWGNAAEAICMPSNPMTEDAVKRALELLLKMHPDRTQEDISAAQEILSKFWGSRETFNRWMISQGMEDDTFRFILERFKAETEYLSQGHHRNPAFHELISIGEPALPYLLREMLGSEEFNPRDLLHMIQTIAQNIGKPVELPNMTPEQSSRIENFFEPVQAWAVENGYYTAVE